MYKFNKIEKFRCRNTLMLAFGIMFIHGCSSSSSSNDPLATIGGQITGLGDEPVVLTLNDEDELTIDSDGPFEFEMGIAHGEDYNVVIISQPGDVACGSENATGSVDEDDVDDIQIECGGLHMSSRQGDASVHLDWWPAVDGDLLYSTDRNCDWSNVQACENGGMIPDVSGGSIDIIAADEGLALDRNYHFSLQMPEHHAATTVGVAPFYQYAAPVLGIVMDDQRIYAGGYGRYFGGATQGISWFRDDGSEMTVTGPNYRLPNGTTQVMVEDPNGGWFVAGQFDGGGDFPNQLIARLHPDGTVDQDWEVTFDGNVTFISDILVHDDHLYIAGRFGEIQGSSDHAALARLTLDGELDEDFNPEIPENPSQITNVDSILASGDHLYVGGNFVVSGDSDVNIGVIDAETGEHIQTFDAATDGRVTAMLLQDDQLYISGRFEEVNNTPRPGLALLDADTGALDTTFTPDIEDPFLMDMELVDNRLFIAGQFETINGSPWNHLAALHAETGVLDINIETETDGVVYTVDHRDGYLYVGGAFSEVNGNSAHRVARLDTANAFQPDDGWHLSFDGIVLGLVETEDKVAVLGLLWTAGGRDVGHLAAFDALTGELDESWDANVRGLVVADLQIHEGELFAVGAFNQAGGESRGHGAAFNLHDGSALDWDPDVSGTQVVTVEPVADGHLAIGGQFTKAGGETRSSLAILDSSLGNAITGTGDPEVLGSVLSLSHFPDQDILFVGGAFGDIGGSDNGNIAAVSDTGLSPITWDPDPNRSVWSVLSDGDDHVLAGGDFTEIGGGAQGRFALLSSGGSVVADTPEANGTVFDMSLDTDSGRLLVAGRFTEFAGEPAIGLAELNLENLEFSPLGPTPEFNGEVRAVAQGNQRIVVGGFFADMSGDGHAGFVIVDDDFQPLIEAPPGRFHASQSQISANSAQGQVGEFAEKGPLGLLDPFNH